MCVCVYIYIPHLLFIHSSVDEHSVHFSILPIANSAAIKLGCLHSFQIMFFSGHMPEPGLLVHMIVLFLVFLRNLYTVLHSGCGTDI